MTAIPGCVVVALGGNAIAAEGHADPVSQQRAVELACGQIATLVKTGHRVVITHGNGPQVGNLLLKNDLARIVPSPDPLEILDIRSIERLLHSGAIVEFERMRQW
jgi:carbamate kinase